jgi:hypothetical protein
MKKKRKRLPQIEMEPAMTITLGPIPLRALSRGVEAIYENWDQIAAQLEVIRANAERIVHEEAVPQAVKIDAEFDPPRARRGRKTRARK